ncbi:transcriptional regulator [Streptomyces sp. BE20]|uniref:transcriptional regulator n=1 Tax=Streptomyces sp. BE20 TaxID=3002525 RepID=UPI002E77C5B1|nr:transcriptional regulator [Streptomyces sp. BE20]MEE1820965.1 transcriptional regulator [Streptomyces sp. BE20]
MRAARRASGIPWAAFARAAGFGEAYLRNIENGNRPVTASVAAAYDLVLKTGGAFGSALADAPAATARHAPWEGATLAVLTELVDGRRVDRRSFIAAGVALSASATSWSRAVAQMPPDRPAMVHVGNPRLLAHLEERLDYLRRVDDELGSGEVHKQAGGELSLAVRLIKAGRHTDADLRRLYTIAAEASRQVAWTAFDQGRFGIAQRHFDASLRASVEAEDVITGAYSLSFAAIQCYSTGQAGRAVSLLDTARTQVRGKATPRMDAMLAARTARALSKTGAKADTAHQLHVARAALDKGRSDDDPKTLYWVDYGEIEMIAGSAALDLGDPAEALRRFAAGMEAYPGDEEYPRTHAIYLARAAEAHLALDDLDGAVAAARHAAACLSSVDSARSASQLKDLRGKLAPHAADPAVRDFLEAG